MHAVDGCMKTTTTLFAAIFALTACGPNTASVDGTDELDTAQTQDELASLKGKFELFVGRDGQTYFHALAGNGEKVLVSEGYATRQGAEAGIQSVKTNGVNEARYLLREASNGQFYFVLTAANGAVIGVSEMYASQSNATRGITTTSKVIAATVAQQDAAANISAKLESFKGLDSKYYFHVKALNGEIVLQSQSYTTKASAIAGMDSVKINAINTARFSVLPAADGKFYFTLKAANGQVIAFGETYASKANAERGVAGVVSLFTANK
jgi:uncharacterized protein